MLKVVCDRGRVDVFWQKTGACHRQNANYLKLIEENATNYLLVKQIKNEVSLLPQEYLETDIYKASREIKKMQKLSSKILTLWYENMSVSNFVIEETV